MKIRIMIGLAAFLLFGAGVALGQSEPVEYQGKTGFVLIAQGQKSVTYNIKLRAVADAGEAAALDAAMLEKQGILSCSTDAQTRICRVEVLKTVTEANLRSVIAWRGLEVAKSFTE